RWRRLAAPCRRGGAGRAPPAAPRADRRFRMGGPRSGADGPRARARGDADLEAPWLGPQRPRLLGNQRSLCRPGARLSRRVEGRALLPRGARPRRRTGRARAKPVERRWRRHRARPPGGRVGHAHRPASPEDAAPHGQEARHRQHLHRRRPRRRDAGGSTLRGGAMERIDPQVLAKHWRWEIDRDRLAWLTFDKRGESANTFSRQALEELRGALRAIGAAQPKGLVIRSAKDNFIAGADVEEFTRFKSPQEAMAFVRLGWDVFQELSELPFPTTAMVNGFCMGGGVELALACRYRVALDEPKTRFALPEVMLGIMPAWHGVQWLPKLVGPAAAFDMLLTGKSVDAKRAKRIGLVDQAVPARILENTARMVTLEAPPRRRLRLLERLMAGPLRGLVVAQARKQVARKARWEHYPAPYAILELWRKYDGNPFAASSDPSASVESLFAHPTTANLIRIFFLQERLKGLGKGADFKPRHVHVVGAGVMGGDIAAICAMRGLTVTLQDTGPDRLAPAVKRAGELYRRRLRDERRVRDALDRLIPDVAGTGARQADVIIEAIFENLPAKRHP